MRYFIISDAHANLEGTQAVLDDMINNFNPGFGRNDRGQDIFVNLGDSIGYGPNPNEVMDILSKISNISCRGNHEDLVAHIIENPKKPIPNISKTYVLNSIYWTARALNDANKARVVKKGNYLKELEDGRILFAHSTPYIPEKMNYIYSSFEAVHHFFLHHPQKENKVAFVGHSHVPQIYVEREKDPVAGGTLKFDSENSEELKKVVGINKERSDERIEVSCNLENCASLIVVPSVGQPRDGFTHTGYAVLDTGSDNSKRNLHIIRLKYDFVTTQDKMRALQLSPILIDRLDTGN